MWKKNATVIGTLILLTFGCAMKPIPRPVINTPDVNVSVDFDDIAEFAQFQETGVMGGAPEISSLSWYEGDTGYTKIFSAISVSDFTRSWNDWTLFKKMGITRVVVMINSPGGDAFTGLALADLVRIFQEEGMEFYMEASGIVASAAVPIFASGGHRSAISSTVFMVHEASLWKWPGRETSSDIRSQGELMGLLGERYRNILVENSNKTYDEWLNMEARTTWFGCDKGLSWGIVDECR